MISVDQIKKLREETDVSVGECQKALKEAAGDLEMAKEILKKRGKSFAEKKAKRETKEGIIESYIHPGKKIGAMVELHCESDFVAKSEDFQKLAHEICLQIAAVSSKEVSMGDEDKSSSSPTERSEGKEENEVLFAFAVARVLEQPWIRDEGKTIKELIDEYIAKLGENIILKRFIRYEI